MRLHQDQRSPGLSRRSMVLVPDSFHRAPPAPAPMFNSHIAIRRTLHHVNSTDNWRGTHTARVEPALARVNSGRPPATRLKDRPPFAKVDHPTQRTVGLISFRR